MQKLEALVAKCEAVLGPDDVDISGACYGMLATVYDATGKPEQAKALHKRSLLNVEDLLRSMD